jgi:hypothetical protein
MVVNCKPLNLSGQFGLGDSPRTRSRPMQQELAGDTYDVCWTTYVASFLFVL